MFDSKTVELFKNKKTPFYFYNLSVLQEVLSFVNTLAKKYNFDIHYAIKANTETPILKTIATYNFGADCVSGNEIKKAIDTGFAAHKIVYAGVGKTDEEINFALDNNIFCFNCESLPELEIIQQLAKNKNKIAPIALRINPNVGADTHKYITTGLEENKFGINLWEIESVLALLSQSPNLNLIGLHFHIGSQITNLNNFKNLCVKVNEIQRWFADHRITIKHINVGGGLGLNYQEPDASQNDLFQEYFKIFNTFLELQPKQTVHFELGRSLVGNCGSLISKVLYIKKGIKTNFAILDAGMTELLRPALYQAFHKIENLSSIENTIEKYDVVGPICESSDCFGKAVELPITQRGDIIAIRTAGAYGHVMSSNYNLRMLEPCLAM